MGDRLESALIRLSSSRREFHMKSSNARAQHKNSFLLWCDAEAVYLIGRALFFPIETQRSPFSDPAKHRRSELPDPADHRGGASSGPQADTLAEVFSDRSVGCAALPRRILIQISSASAPTIRRLCGFWTDHLGLA